MRSSLPVLISALPLLVSACAPPPPPHPPYQAAQRVIDTQLATGPVRGASGLSGAEAEVIYHHYLSRIGARPQQSQSTSSNAAGSGNSSEGTPSQ